MTINDSARSPQGGARLLDAIDAFARRFVAYPSEHARVAHVLWIAHTHLMDKWDTTPRFAATSKEPWSGKTRVLEITEPLVPRPAMTTIPSAAYLFRKMGHPDGRPTILYDEIDALFAKAKGNEDIIALVNEGYRKNATVGRCESIGKSSIPVDIPAFAAVAVAGLGYLPPALASRSIILRMRRRRPNERVEPWRFRIHFPEGERLRDQLSAWATAIKDSIRYPQLPEGIEDRAADIWEPLVAVADAAGGAWPRHAREAALDFTKAQREQPASRGIRLLSDMRLLWGDAVVRPTKFLLRALHELPESEWKEIVGRREALNDYGLAAMLREYEIEPKDIRFGTKVLRGYHRDHLVDAWDRLLPLAPQQFQQAQQTDETSREPAVGAGDVADVGDVGDVGPTDQRQAKTTNDDDLAIPAFLRRVA